MSFSTNTFLNYRYWFCSQYFKEQRSTDYIPIRRKYELSRPSDASWCDKSGFPGFAP